MVRCPYLADEFVECEPSEALASSDKVPDCREVCPELVVVVDMEPFHGRALDRALHPLDPASRPTQGTLVGRNVDPTKTRPFSAETGRPSLR